MFVVSIFGMPSDMGLDMGAVELIVSPALKAANWGKEEPAGRIDMREEHED